MSFWVQALCNKSVGSETADSLKQGIAQRLKVLTYLFCPDEEEDPDAVLKRLDITSKSQDGVFRNYLMRYRTGSSFIRIDRHNRSAVEELEQENPRSQ